MTSIALVKGRNGGGREQRWNVAQNVNVTLPRMLQRRNAVSSESVRPGTFDDDQFVIQSYPKNPAQRARIQDILSGIVLFQGLSEKIMKDLVGGFCEVKYNNSDVIIVQGDIIADRFFLLESGQCDIFVKKGSSDPVKVHTVLPGGFFGELALLYNAPRAATVCSVGESKLWALDRGTFKNCMARASREEIQGDSLKNVSKSAQSIPTQQRGAFALIDEQVMKALDQHGKDALKHHFIPEWNTIVEMTINSSKSYQRLLKFSHPHVLIYKLAQMDASSQSLVHADVTEPRHSIFLPLCHVKPTGISNTILLEGHHLDGTITFKFADARDQSKFIDVAKKSREIYSIVSNAYQEVRFVSAGGQVPESSKAEGEESNCGVGLYIDYSKNGRSFTVRGIVPGSPAAACGLISVHDHILMINGVSAKHSFASLQDVVDSIRGYEGTKVRLHCRKCSGPRAKSIYEVTLVRAPHVALQTSDVIENADTHSQEQTDSSKFDDTTSNGISGSEDEGLILQCENDALRFSRSKSNRSDGLKTLNVLNTHPVFPPQFENAAVVHENVQTHQSQSRYDGLGKPDSETGTKNRFRCESTVENSALTLPQDLHMIVDVEEKLSRYLQALSSPPVACSSTKRIHRPLLKSFPTGLGVMLSPTEDNCYRVISIASNSPARNVMTGDLLWAIDHEPVASKSQEDICKILNEPDTDVILSLSRQGTNIHILLTKQTQKLDHGLLVGKYSADSSNHHANMVLSPMHKSGTAQHQTTATHAFQKGSHSWLISYGFSINKSSEGAFVVTSLNSSDIRRFEVGDVIATVDGHVLLPEYALEDVARMLEEPPGTSAQVTLLRRSSGTSVVMRKSAQFLRMSNHHTMDSFDHHFDFHHAKTHNNSKELIKIDTTSETVWNNEANDEGHSENSVASASSLSQTFSSSSASNFSCLESGVGLAFHEQNSATEKCYVVDRILQLSPAHYCGQINVGDKLIEINGQTQIAELSLESIISQIAGPEGSQVTLKFVRPNTDVDYSVTLTRCSLRFLLNNHPPSSNRDSEITQPIRLPFQTIPPSSISSGMITSVNQSQPVCLPIQKTPMTSLESVATYIASSTLPISKPFESTFSRCRAERDASVDYNCAFRLKEISASIIDPSRIKAITLTEMLFPSKISNND